MLNDKTIAVIVPCFNEEQQITRVLATLPEFVDLVIVVNDASTDATAAVVRKFMGADRTPFITVERRVRQPGTGVYARAENLAQEMEREAEQSLVPYEEIRLRTSRVVLLNHQHNTGRGAALANGYCYARAHRIACTATMDGDGQMDPGELESLCRPVVEGRADYCKGNRFKHRSARRAIPRVRYVGNAGLSLLTKIATGYWRISDTQTGFTALGLEALENLDVHLLYPRYGSGNDLLQKLNIANFTLSEVPITPHYAVGEQSKLKVGHVAPRIAGLLLRLFVQRLVKKYLVQTFHPLFLLYVFSLLAFLVDIPLTARFLYAYFAHHEIWMAHLTLATLIGIFSFQSLVFAMWFDINDNDRLYV
ncbi:MAG: glycosyltransferase family 2 protein [Kiritimatiellaeota bacterium]|nr:glycosyltransferase family 2 protein [Kiritimatiellota bacterium]